MVKNVIKMLSKTMMKKLCKCRDIFSSDWAFQNTEIKITESQNLLV